MRMRPAAFARVVGLVVAPALLLLTSTRRARSLGRALWLVGVPWLLLAVGCRGAEAEVPFVWSVVVLHPDGAEASRAVAGYVGQQAGTAEVGGIVLASLLTGTADSWISLHDLLPGTFTDSAAEDIWESGGTLYVAGYGQDAAFGAEVALLWVYGTEP